ncbi:MAG: thiamine pyrophosphate-binding protein [Chloroflexi bacterium]|nr:thiamine pyrophosphate-binding protein [Chloroflexota bacterium]
MATMTGASVLVRSLRAHGVEAAFGIPSNHTIEVWDALYHEPAIRFIGGRHEEGLAHMAEGYARASGKAGVAITSAGPGAAKTMSPMGEAYAHSSPVLHIASQVPSELVGKEKGVLHDTKDQLGMFRSVTAWCTLIERVEEIHPTVSEAFRRFQTKRPRPVHLEIPADIISKATSVDIEPPVESPRPKGDPERVEAAVTALKAARRPVLWGGGGVICAEASEKFVRLAERLGAPVLTTVSGKGSIPADHPLYLGPFTTSAPVRDFLKTCDVMVAVGTRFTGGRTANWTLPLPRQVIHVDIDPREMGKNFPATISIVGDAGEVLDQMLELMGEEDFQKGPELLKDADNVKAQAVDAFKDGKIPGAYGGANQLRTMLAIREVLPRDGLMICDPCVPTYSAQQGFPTYQPRTFFYPHGWVTLGWGFPFSVGAKVARPHRPVALMIGDGGFMYNAQELATAMLYGINVAVILFNDNAWGTIKEIQRTRFAGRYFGVDLHNPDFMKFAEAFGAPGVRVSTLKELLPALEKALQAPLPTIIEVEINNGFANFT